MFRKLALLLALAVASPAAAENFHYGAWTMTRQLDTNRNLMCLLHTYWPDKSFLYIKSFVNEPFLQVEVSDPRWRLKAGTQVPVTLRFDNTPWNVKSNVISYDEDGTFGLHSLVSNDELAQWLQRFALAKSMRIEFPGSREDFWKVSVNGSAAATSKFIECIKDQEATTPQNTNPFGDPSIEPNTEDDTRNPFTPVAY